MLRLVELIRFILAGVNVMLAPFSFSHITASSLCYEEIMKSRYAVPYTEHLFVSLHKKWIVSATTRVSRAAREEHCFKKWHVKGNQNLFFIVISRWNPFWKMKCSQIRGVIRICYISSVLTEGCWDSHRWVKPTQKSTLNTNRRGHLIVPSDLFGDPVEEQPQALPSRVNCSI